MNQIVTVEPSRMALQPQAHLLTNFAVQYRYPGWIATKAQAKQAIKDCREVRRVPRTDFRLPI
jgi:hypothetical protein